MADRARDATAGARIAIVGAAGGIGRVLVDELVAAECRIAALDLPASLSGWEAPRDVLACPLDATDPAAVDTAFARVAAAFDGLDGLVCLAGFTAPRQSLTELSPDVFDAVVAGNLASAFLCSRGAARLLARGREAAIVLVASGLAVKATPGYGPYAAAKAGVIALTRTLAAELAPSIRVNAVAPGAVDTAFLTGGTGRAERASGFDRDAYLKTVPLGRMARPADVTGPIRFLLGPEAAYMTGQTLHVNGGLLMA